MEDDDVEHGATNEAVEHGGVDEAFDSIVTGGSDEIYEPSSSTGITLFELGIVVDCRRVTNQLVSYITFSIYQHDFF